MTAAASWTEVRLPVVEFSRDRAVPHVLEGVVFWIIVVYLILNRLIADVYVLPVGMSIRPYELVLVLLLLAWVVWMVYQPTPLPSGSLGLVGLLMFAAMGAAPFLNGLDVTPFQANGAERGLFRLVVFTGLFLASYHIGFRLSRARALVGWVLGATAAQAALALYEFVTAKPVEALTSLALSLGLEFDAKGLRPEQLDIDRRVTGEIRAATTAPHPIVLSAIVAVGLLVAACWILYSHRGRARRGAVAALVLTTLALPLANSRTAFFILGISALPLLLLLVRSWPRLIPLTLGGLVAAAASFAVSPGTPRLILNSFTNPSQDENTQVRVERFALLPEMIERRPVLGAGYLSHDPAIQIFDNAYNLALVELGIVGLALVVLFFLTALNWCRKAFQRCTDPAEALVPLVGVIAGLALLAGGMTFDAWTFDQFLPTCLILLGVGSGRAVVILRRPDSGRRLGPLSPAEATP